MIQVLKKITPITDLHDVYVVADFDRTLTKGNSKTSWSLLASTELLPEEYIIDRDTYYQQYRPIEVDTSLPFEYRLEQMSIWFRAHIELFVKYQLQEEFINSVARDANIMKFRDGAKEFLRFLSENEIPLIIISAGVGNFIRAFLEQEQCLYNNIFISSNMIEFENGIARGVSNNIIHSLNKNEVSLPEFVKERIKNCSQVLLFGDQIDDTRMVSEEKRAATTRVGFLLDEEKREDYAKHFDLICTDDTSYEEIQKTLFL